MSGDYISERLCLLVQLIGLYRPKTVACPKSKIGGRYGIVILLLAIIFFYPLLIHADDSDGDRLKIEYSNPLQEKYRRAMTFYWDGQYPDAELAFQEIIDSHPEHANAYIYQADCRMAMGKTADASSGYDTAYQLLEEKLAIRKELVPDVREPEIYSDMAYCLNATGRYEEAKRLGMMGTFKGKSPDLYVNIAYSFYKMGDPKKAQTNFCKSQKIATPKEKRNLTAQRLTTLFQNGKDWTSCPAESPYEQKGVRYALLIAVGKYMDHRINPLQYVVNDVQKLYNTITNPRTGLFRPKNVTLLINEDATEKNIKFKFDDMVLKAKNEKDMFFVFYAGHGFTYPEGTDTYWLTHDTIVGDGEGNRIKSTAFSNLTLATKIADIKANTVVFFIDACFSSGMVSKPASIRGLESYLASGKNYFIVTSSQADQLSIESPRLKHGLFSYALLKGLEGEADLNSDGMVEVEELWPFVKTYVSEQAKMMGAEQTPRRSGSSGGEIYLSKNPYY